MAEEFERYLAKVNFQHTFENIKERLLKDGEELVSPAFYARNVPFQFRLMAEESKFWQRNKKRISFNLSFNEFGEDSSQEFEEGYSLKVRFQLFLISPSKTIHSEEISCTFQNWDNFHNVCLSEIFPGKKIIVDDSITIKISLWADEPEGMSSYNPPKATLRHDLQIVEKRFHRDAFASFLDSGDFSDVTFVVNRDSSKVKAHKGILAARSDVFERMLTTDMREAKENEIIIDDMDATVLKIMLRHIYTGQVGFPKGVKVDLKICQELVNAGEKYNLQNLKEYAAMAMTEYVTLENAWELLSFATQFKAKAATKALSLYYGGNVHSIVLKV